jgi:putative intracellular protease/amidase
MNNKKILMVLAPKEFRDLEYIVPKVFFEKANLEITTTSSEKKSI